MAVKLILVNLFLIPVVLAQEGRPDRRGFLPRALKQEVTAEQPVTSITEEQDESAIARRRLFLKNTFKRRPFLGAKPVVEIETPESIPDEETVIQQRIKIKIPNQVNFLSKF